MKTMVIDPGTVHCGWALFAGKELYDMGEDKPAELYQRVSREKPNRIVLERMTIRPGKKNIAGKHVMRGREIIGVIKGIALGIDATVYENNASDRKIGGASPFYKSLLRSLTDEEIKKLKNGHIRSAVCHGIHFFYFGKGSKLDG